MGVDTKAIIRKGVTIEQIQKVLKEKYDDVKVDACDNEMFRVFFLDKEDKRTLWVSFSDSCLRDYGIDGVWCSLGMWGNSVQILRYLCETFGGYLDENDCDNEGFYPINFHLYSQGSEFTKIDEFRHSVIEKIGIENLGKAIELFEKYKTL